MTFEIVGTPAADREERVRLLKDMGFAWADIGQEPYWVDQAVVMDRKVWEELWDASRLLWAIFDKAARFVLGRRGLYGMLSIPEVLWDGLEAVEPGPPGLLSLYARFDFSVGEGGTIKLLELNADTPTGYVEASVVTPWMCGELGLWTPNETMAGRIREAWAAEPPAYAACTGYGEHVEDSGTIDMLVRHSGFDVRCVDTLELWVDEGVLRDGEGKTIPSLFALYPKEWMGVDDGGEALAYSIETGRLRIMNPPHAVILQSKGLQAVIWGLHEMRAPMFTAEEHDAIEAYMLPTYDSPVFERDYVVKSMFGREGGSVLMYGADGSMDVKDEDGFDTSVFFRDIYQERADLPRIRLHDGDCHLLTGVFIIGGEACGLLGRARRPHYRKYQPFRGDGSEGSLSTNSYYSRKRNTNIRMIMAVGIGLLVILVIVGIVKVFTASKPSVLSKSNSGSSASSGGASTVPWDYRIEEAKIGDLVGADMTLLPNNQLLPNDGNYATGDKVWVLSLMSAEMTTLSDGQNKVELSTWAPLKTYRTAEAAQEDLANLKVEVKTDVDLVGVYKTEYQGKYRQFALLSLPTGHTIKQPVAEDRYNSFKDKKQVKVILEEIHDFGDYDLAMSKFRGWAE